MPTTVLVVDDDTQIRRMLERTLAAEGHEVTAVADGGAALAAVERLMPDVVVLDAVVQQPAGAEKRAAPLQGMPRVSIDGATGTELATALGTMLTFDQGGVRHVLIGSLPAAAAEAAARELR
jgi:CheY-like chemotaxis protein